MARTKLPAAAGAAAADGTAASESLAPSHGHEHERERERDVDEPPHKEEQDAELAGDSKAQQVLARRALAAAVPGIAAAAGSPFHESYRDMDELRRALKVLSVQLNAPYYMQHSSPQRVEARCPTWRHRKAAAADGVKKQAPAAPVCGFVVSANRHANGRVYVTRAVVEHSPGCPAIAALHGEHTISAAALLETARPIMDALLSSHAGAEEHTKLLEALGIDSTTLAVQGHNAVRPKDMAKLMKEKFGVSTSYMAAWRALSALRQQRRNEDSASYQKIRGYLDNFAASNPGSVTAFEHLPNSSTFARAFLAPGALAPDAVRYCRTNVLLSVLLVTSAFGGVVLTATAQDAMGDHVPLAIALVPAETEAEWRWFLGQLGLAFPSLEREATSFVHNRGNDLRNAVTTVFPNSDQSDKVEAFLKSSIVGAAPVATIDGDPTSNTVVSAIAATSLQWIEVLCSKAPLMILVGWVSKVASTLFQRFEKYATVSSEYPAAFHTLACQYESAAGHFDVLRVSESGFEVVDKRSGRQRVVDFAKQSCSCGEYDATNFPCLHVFLAVSFAGMLRADVIPPIYLMTSLKSLYGGRVTPIDVDTVLADGVTAPLPAPKTRGRPRKIQQISQFGDTKQEKLSCSVCGVKGHNKRTCKRAVEEATSGAATSLAGSVALSVSSNVAASASLERAMAAGLEHIASVEDDDGAGFLNGACTYCAALLTCESG